MVVERYLCLKLSGKIHGIDLSKLVPIEDEVDVDVQELRFYSEENKERGRPPPPPLPPPSSFDFTIDLPAHDMQVFSLDSKIFLIGGSNDDDESCYQIYEFQIDNDKKAQLNLLESTPKAPTYIDSCNSWLGCNLSEAYFLVCDEEEFSFWVLQGCGGKWERLPLNTILETQDTAAIGKNWFYPDNRLFLPIRVQSDHSERVLCCFHLQTRQWTMEEIDRHGSMRSFNLCFNEHDPLPLLPCLLVSSVAGLEDYTNYGVMLSYSSQMANAVPVSPRFPSTLHLTTIYAMLVNQNGVCVYQRISSCFLFKRIKPYFTHVKEAFFVDLGQGKTCAVLFGFASQDWTQKPETESIVLCISIFTLTLKDEFDVTANNYGEARFLSVRVLSSHVYTIQENLEYMPMARRLLSMDYDVDIQQVFVSPPP